MYLKSGNSHFRAIFPLLQSYADSGHRSRRRRFISALRQNLRYHAILLGVFGLGLVYILFTVKLTSFADFESLLIALANTYGLLLAIFCMGHGLVNTPRRIWQASNLDFKIREIERSAVAAWENKAEAEDEATRVTGEIASWEAACVGRDDPLANWVRELALRNPGGEEGSLEGGTLTEEYLSLLTRRARTTHNRLLKTQTNWAWIIRRAGYLYDLNSAAGTPGRTIEWKLSSPGRVGRFTPRSMQYMWYLVVSPWLLKGVSVLTAVVSVSIVWSEMVHNWTSPLLSLVGIVILSTGRIWFLMEVILSEICLIPDSNNIDSIIHGVCDVFHFYAIEDFEHVRLDSAPHRSRFNPFLCFISLPSNVFPHSHSTDKSIPLAFNFTTLLAPPEGEDLSIFSMFLGQYINLNPLGSGFNAWFPLFILLPVTFTFFSLYDKINGILGLGDLGGWIIEDDEDEDRGEVFSVIEGRGILKRELGLTGSSTTVPRRTFPEGRVLGGERVIRPAYSDTPESDDDSGENFFVATGHRLWNSISTRVDDLRSDNSFDGGRDSEGEEGGLLAKIPRPKWLKRGESGVSVWRLPKWGRNENAGRVVL